MKFLYKKIVAFVAIIAVVALGLSVIKPVSAATVSPTVTNLKAQASGQKVTFSFDWDLTGKSVKEGDTFTIDAPEGVNITEVATQSLQANGAEVATISMTNKKITFTFKKAIESMNQNVKGASHTKQNGTILQEILATRLPLLRLVPNPLSSHVLMVLEYLNLC